MANHIYISCILNPPWTISGGSRRGPPGDETPSRHFCSGNTRALITTDVLGRGVDIPDVSWCRCRYLGPWKRELPSGKHTKNDGKSPFSMGKTTISMVIFNSYVKLPEGRISKKKTNKTRGKIRGNYIRNNLGNQWKSTDVKPNGPNSPRRIST